MCWEYTLNIFSPILPEILKRNNFSHELQQSDGEELMQLESSPVPAEPPSSDLDMEVILDEPPDTTSEFNFEFSDITSYR